jgi:hypothetical protein
MKIRARSQRRRSSRSEGAFFKKDTPKETPFFGPANGVVQRKCGTCEEESQVQAKTAGSTASPGKAVTSYIGSANSKGQPLSKAHSQFFGSRMGHDFSDVKVHTGAEASRSATSINALAYTYRNHIVFREGQFNPSTATGKKLLAHELAHVAQQRAQPALQHKLQRSLTVTSPYPKVEDFDPGNQFRKQLPTLGLCEPFLNGINQKPSLGAKRFEKALNMPGLTEKNLDAISRPNLKDPELDPVWNNLLELKTGSSGKRVKLVQEALIAWGQGLDNPINPLPKFGADNFYGNETRDAVVLFQQEHPLLAVDGIVGDLTLGELDKEMGKLTGSVFTLTSVGHQDFGGLIHIPPASSQWTSVRTPTNAFFENKGVDDGTKAIVASQLGKCKPEPATLLVIFRENAPIAPGIEAHERLHQVDQVATIEKHLRSWDLQLEIARAINFRFKAKDKDDAMRQLFIRLGIPSPSQLSKNIIAEWIQGNQQRHATPAGARVKQDVSLQGCTTVVFIFG